MSHPKKPRKKIFLIILLAFLCIGGMELLVCRFAAPELFFRITNPVVQAAHSVADTVADRISTVSREIQRRTAALKSNVAEEKEVDNQEASAPAVEDPQPTEDPKITEFIKQGNYEVLTGGNVELVYFNQGEEPWASHYYGPDPIAGYGCGPTAMSMVVSTLSGKLIDPATMAQWAYEQGYCAPGSGSYHSLIRGTAAAYGLEVENWSDFSASALSESLASGHIFVALMTRGHFTSNGHFIVLRGITLEGKVLVADPNSRQRSLTAWDPQLIVDELSPARGSGAPLWCFSTISPAAESEL